MAAAVLMLALQIPVLADIPDFNLAAMGALGTKAGGGSKLRANACVLFLPMKAKDITDSAGSVIGVSP